MTEHKNYETWVTIVWIDFHKPLRAEIREIAYQNRHKSRLIIGEAIREKLFGGLNLKKGIISDILNNAWQEIDWQYVADYYSQDDPDDDKDYYDEETTV